ncbi:hypothetical protein AWB73_05728 [Caballeronia turbans]|jgi:hypothetical protein|nr:hypothetical protein [Caballeronia sp. INML2]SAL53406.1 hypothetical protein AWB73_05728 [Caballeronia turbans]
MNEKFKTNEIIAGPDRVCVYVFTDHGERMEHCDPEAEVVSRGLFL